MKTIYIGQIPEAFGYSIEATGASRKDCEKALWDEFLKRQKSYDSLHDITSLKKAFEYFGGGVSQVSIGRAYFGGFQNG